MKPWWFSSNYKIVGGSSRHICLGGTIVDDTSILQFEPPNKNIFSKYFNSDFTDNFKIHRGIKKIVKKKKPSILRGKRCGLTIPAGEDIHESTYENFVDCKDSNEIFRSIGKGREKETNRSLTNDTITKLSEYILCYFTLFLLM